MQVKFGLEFPLIEANAEDVPLPDESFDLAVSEYGASIWCDPYLWIAEAARLLRPGGELVFLRQRRRCSMLCVPGRGQDARTELRRRRTSGMHRFEWEDDDPGVEFHLGYGDWIWLLRDERLPGRRPDRAVRRPRTLYARVLRRPSRLEWAKQWPAEEIWRLRLTPQPR